MIVLRIMSWNIGFGSTKKSLHAISNEKKADAILQFIRKLEKGGCPIDAIALQEMVNRHYVDSSSFLFARYFIEESPFKDTHTDKLHFEVSLSLGINNSYPHGKLKTLFTDLGILEQEQGPGIWIRHINGWKLKNLYADGRKMRIETADDEQVRAYAIAPKVEVQRPLPYPLYMGDAPGKSTGRDEEDRPLLWSRIHKTDMSNRLKIYFVSLHLPTLFGEESKPPISELTVSQQNLAENVLGLSTKHGRVEKSRGLAFDSNFTVDVLGSQLRAYMLRQLIYQANRIEQYWKNDPNENSCVFIFAGDFNFYHTQTDQKFIEQSLLEEAGFFPAKLTGTTRPINKKHSYPRLIDNIWVRGAEVEECLFNGVPIEHEASGYQAVLEGISDHYPVVGVVRIKNKY